MERTNQAVFLPMTISKWKGSLWKKQIILSDVVSRVSGCCNTRATQNDAKWR